MRASRWPLTFLFSLLATATIGCPSTAVESRAQGGAQAALERPPLRGAPASPAPVVPQEGERPREGQALAQDIVARTFGALRGHQREMVLAPTSYRLQAAFTHLPAMGAAVTSSFRGDAEYLYPASAIKIFASVGMLLWLQEQRREVPSLGLDSEILACPDRAGPCEVIAEASNRQGETLTLGHVVRKMHLVSDNKAFNTLYDLVGHREIHERFWALGYSSLRVHHRMFSRGDAAAQRTTPRFELRTRTGVIVEIPRRESVLALPATPASGLLVGNAHRSRGGRWIDTPMDFAHKNFVSIGDLHRLILAIHAPASRPNEKLRLESDLLAFLTDAMTTLPHRSPNPRYVHHRESWGRFKPTCRGFSRMEGAEQISCANKAGNAYGFLIDNTFLRNDQTGDAVALTVGMYVNPNGVINDDEYAYDEEGRPLLAAIGAAAARELLGRDGPTPRLNGDR